MATATVLAKGQPALVWHPDFATAFDLLEKDLSDHPLTQREIRDCLRRKLKNPERPFSSNPFQKDWRESPTIQFQVTSFVIYRITNMGQLSELDCYAMLRLFLYRLYAAAWRDRPRPLSLAA